MSFAQRLRGQTKRRSQGKGGKALLNMRFGARFTPLPYPTWFRLIEETHLAFDGTDVPFFEYVEHFAKKRSNKGFICGRGWKEVEDGRGGYHLIGNGQCAGCHELDIPDGSGERGPNAVKDVSFRRLSSFLGVHLEDYHLIEARDNRNNVLTYERETKYHKQGDPILRRVLCEGRQCPHCKERYEKVFGKIVHWSLGGGHLKALSSFADELEKECKNCGERLVDTLYMCPECNEVLIDMNSTELTDEQLLDITSRPVKCKACRRTIMLSPIYDCTGCKDPAPTTPFDVDMYVKKVGGKEPGDFPVLDFVKHRVCDLDPGMEDMLPRNREGERQDVLQRVFKADPLKIQCDVLNVRSPFATAEGHSTPYGQRDKDDGAPEEEDIPF